MEDASSFNESKSRLGKHTRDAEELLLAELDRTSSTKRQCKSHFLGREAADHGRAEQKPSNDADFEDRLILPSAEPSHLSVSELLQQPAPPADEVFAVNKEIVPEGTERLFNSLDEDSVLGKEGLSTNARSEPLAIQLGIEQPEQRPMLDHQASQQSSRQPGKKSSLTFANQHLSYPYIINVMGTQQASLVNSQHDSQRSTGHQVNQRVNMQEIAAAAAPSMNPLQAQYQPPRAISQTSLKQNPNFLSTMLMFPPVFNPMFQQAPCVPTVPSRGISLSLACDRDHLSEYQMVVRKQLEIFEARPEDVDSVTQGRKKQVVLGQVGLRCSHCAEFPLRARNRGSVYYPMTLEGIYQAAQNMAQTHLSQSCKHVPDQLKQDLKQLRERRGVACGGKRYWTSCAQALGLVQTDRGLRLRRGPAGLQSSGPAG